MIFPTVFCATGSFLHVQGKNTLNRLARAAPIIANAYLNDGIAGIAAIVEGIFDNTPLAPFHGPLPLSVRGALVIGGVALILADHYYLEYRYQNAIDEAFIALRQLEQQLRIVRQNLRQETP